MGLRNIIAQRDQVQNSLGNPLAGGTVFLFEPGTTTLIQAFQDFGLITPLAVPIKLSGSGRANIWIIRDADMRIEDRNGNLILTESNVNPDSLGTTEIGNLIANGGFEIDTDSDGTPDQWILVNETGSTNARDTSESTEGAASFRFTSAGTGGGNLTTNNFFPVNDVDPLRVIFDIRSTLATVRNIVRVEWYDVSQIFISNTDVYDSITNPTSFLSQSLAASPPALARFAKIKLIGIDPSVALAGSTFFDRIEIFYPVEVLGIFDNITIQNNEIITTDTDGDLALNPDGTGRVLVQAPTLVVGETGAGFAIVHAFNDQELRISGGNTTIQGANIRLGGGSAADTGDMEFFNDANRWMFFDESTGIYDLLTGIGVKSIAMRVDASQNVEFFGDVTDQSGIVGFPSGTLMLFQQTAAPTGWTKQVTHNDKALRVVSGAAGSAGTDPFTTVFGANATDSHTLTISQMPSHNHQQQAHNATAATHYGISSARGTAPAATDEPVTLASGGGTGHAHNIDLSVQYVDVIIASKD